MTDILPHLLLALAAVIVVGRLLAKLFAYIGQPPVIGEVVAGILLGPSLLGSELSGKVLPVAVAPYLGALAQLGVVLYMFLVGLELNVGLLRSRGLATLTIAQACIVLPFLLGVGSAWWLYPVLSDETVPFASFALFLGVAMSITAFPVLARILTDRGIDKTELGVLALGCAAIGDVTAWCLLAFVVGVAKDQTFSAVAVAALALAYIAFIFLIVRPLTSVLVRRWEKGPITPATLAWVFAAVLLSALATEQIGIHAIFGAFLLGAVISHDSRLAHEVTRKTHDVVTVLLLPAFFAYTGMRTEIGLVSGLDQWLLCGAIIVIATTGKFCAALASARLTGFDWRTSASLGVLMNTRGLMELIVLNVGLELGVISRTLFAMMVLMALVTTMATTPILCLMNRGPRSSVTESPATSASAS
ncbi:MAG TPA: cation:proton antiporter [Gemmataceae bacterium]|nr:cation:proton antiporter [Gemmataceae bacterium]